MRTAALGVARGRVILAMRRKVERWSVEAGQEVDEGRQTVDCDG